MVVVVRVGERVEESPGESTFDVLLSLTEVVVTVRRHDPESCKSSTRTLDFCRCQGVDIDGLGSS